jgi:hypothetical protein
MFHYLPLGAALTLLAFASSAIIVAYQAMNKSHAKDTLSRIIDNGAIGLFTPQNIITVSALSIMNAAAFSPNYNMGFIVLTVAITLSLAYRNASLLFSAPPKTQPIVHDDVQAA